MTNTHRMHAIRYGLLKVPMRNLRFMQNKSKHSTHRTQWHETLYSSRKKLFWIADSRRFAVAVSEAIIRNNCCRRQNRGNSTHNSRDLYANVKSKNGINHKSTGPCAHITRCTQAAVVRGTHSMRTAFVQGSNSRSSEVNTFKATHRRSRIHLSNAAHSTHSNKNWMKSCSAAIHVLEASFSIHSNAGAHTHTFTEHCTHTAACALVFVFNKMSSIRLSGVFVHPWADCASIEETKYMLKRIKVDHETKKSIVC